MAQKTITLVDVNVTSWLVDVESERVLANYAIIDSWGGVYALDQAIFWRDIPDRGVDEEGEPIPTPENWYQLPGDIHNFGQKTYLQVLAQLTADIKAGLMHLTREE